MALDTPNVSVDEGVLGMGNVKEKSETISEADLGIVSENIKNARKVWDQIQKDNAQNALKAEMLSIILNNINDDELLGKLFKVIFFDLVDVENVFEIFLPFFQSKMSNSEILEEYKTMNFDIKNIGSYCDYLKKTKLKDTISKDQFISLIEKIILYFDLGEIKIVLQTAKDEEKQKYIEKLSQSLEKELFDNLD